MTRRTRPAAHVEDTPDTPTIDTLVDHLNERFPRDDRPWAAGDTLKNVLVTLDAARRHPRAPRHRRARATARSTRSGSGAQVEPAEVEAFDEKDFARNPALVKGYIGPAVLGADKPARGPLPVDPRVVEGTRWVTGANEPGQPRHRPRRRPRLHRGRHHRGRRGARGRRVPQLRAPAGGRPRHRDGPHLPARHEVCRGARPQGARRERQARRR